MFCEIFAHAGHFLAHIVPPRRRGWRNFKPSPAPDLLKSRHPLLGNELSTVLYFYVMHSRVKYIIGIDEAGRGSLAGPVAVGAVLVPTGFDFSVLGDVRDSKQLSEKMREEIFKKTRALVRAGKLRYAVALVGTKAIDRVGITGAVALGIRKTLTRLQSDPKATYVLLDGLLRAPKEFISQKTVTKGDQLHKEISLASIMAKVTRDRHMTRLAKKYPRYGFDIHKGYGTALHIQAAKIHGLTPQHRPLFCRNLQAKS